MIARTTSRLSLHRSLDAAGAGRRGSGHVRTVAGRHRSARVPANPSQVWTRIRRPVRDGLSVIGAVVLLVLIAQPWDHGSDAWATGRSTPRIRMRLRRATSMRPLAFATRRRSPCSSSRSTPCLGPCSSRVGRLLLVGAVVWLGRGWGLALLAVYPVALEVAYGNVTCCSRSPSQPVPISGALVARAAHEITPGIGLFWFVRPARVAASRHRPRRDAGPRAAVVCRCPRTSGRHGSGSSRTRRRCRTPARSAFVPRWLRFRGGVWDRDVGRADHSTVDRADRCRHRDTGRVAVRPGHARSAAAPQGVGPISPQVASRCHSRDWLG